MPSSIQLANLELALVNVINRERRLQDYIEVVAPYYDYIIIDTSPNLGMLTVNALACSDEIIIPVPPQYLPLIGLQQLLKNISSIKKQLNKKLNIMGIVITLADMRGKFSRDVINVLSENYGEEIKIFDTIVPISVRK